MYPFFQIFPVLGLLLQATVSANTCFANDKDGDICSEDMTIDSKDTDEYMKFIENGRQVFIGLQLFHFIENANGMKETLTIKTASDWLVQNIEKYPKAASTIGLGISVWLLFESISDEATANVKKEYTDLMNTPASDFITAEVYLKHIFKQTNIIRNHVVQIKSWQTQKTIFKAIMSVIFGWLGWSTKDPVLTWSSYIASVASGTAAAINTYNWYELNKLVDKLDKSGYIV